MFALAVNEIRPQHGLFKRVVQSISYLPHFVAVVIIVGLMYELFSTAGIVNQIIEALGLEPVKFLGSLTWFRPMYLGSAFYQSVGWSSIIYLAALAGIPVELYEAAIVDGASRRQQIRYVTLPGLLPTIRVLFILSASVIVSVSFERAYLLQTPGTYSVSDVIDTYVYRRGLVKLDFSYGTAVGLASSVVAFIIVFFTNWFAKRTSEEGEGLW
jgi:putative aldouronate transport system permease protein